MGDEYMIYQGIKRKVFISHYRGDRDEVDAFLEQFANRDKVFTPYVLGANDNDDFINSTDPDYVMKKTREKYLQDTTVTIVLIGRCTHSRRYVDWELKSSLSQGVYALNGVIGIVLPSQNNAAYLPPRLEANWNKDNKFCYARYWSYPNSAEALAKHIEDAYSARTQRAQWIANSQEMMKYNAKCKICNQTH